MTLLQFCDLHAVGLGQLIGFIVFAILVAYGIKRST